MEREALTMNVDQMGESLQVSRKTAYRIASDPAFYPAFRVGKRIIISVDLLKKWIEEQGRSRAV